MKEQVFQRPDCMIQVKWEGDIAWLQWSASKNAESLNALAIEVKQALLDEGVKRILTCVSCAEQNVYERALEFGFIPWELTMILPIDPTFNPNPES